MFCTEVLVFLVSMFVFILGVFSRWRGSFALRCWCSSLGWCWCSALLCFCCRAAALVFARRCGAGVYVVLMFFAGGVVVLRAAVLLFSRCGVDVFALSRLGFRAAVRVFFAGGGG